MVTLTIERLGLKGDGIGRADGQDLYVPYTLPGDTVSGEVVDGRIAGAVLEDASPHRQIPPCVHFGTCGGCALQHASDEFLAAWKQDTVARALEAQGLETPFRPIRVSPPLSRRRAVFAGRRTKKTVIVGFHGRASTDCFEVPECQLLHPDLLAGMPAFRELARAGASRKGAVRISATLCDNGLDVQVSDAKPLDGQLRSELAGIVAGHKLLRLGWNDEVVAMRTPPLHRFGKALVTPPPGAFLQATAQGEAALVEAVREIVGPARHVVDLFSGCGTFTLPLAETAEVHAVEGDAEMIKALDGGWRKTPGLKAVHTDTRDLFRRPLLAQEFDGVEAVVIDPPRAGAVAQCQVLATTTVPRIAYVSCNPVTFARDARALEQGGYRLDWVQVVDQFRWSTHSELVASFSRE